MYTLCTKNNVTGNLLIRIERDGIFSSMCISETNTSCDENWIRYECKNVLKFLSYSLLKVASRLFIMTGTRFIEATCEK